MPIEDEIIDLLVATANRSNVELLEDLNNVSVEEMFEVMLFYF